MKKKIEFCLLTTTLYFLQLSSLVLASDWSEIKDSIYSSALKETREFQVLLPKDYQSNTNQSYEVIYVLDGQYYIEQVPFIVNWTIQSGYMPETILVIVPNIFKEGVNQRMRDFTPTRSPQEEYTGVISGGADNFLTFLTSELAPYVEDKYRTNGNQSLLGSSLSGLFVVYTFLVKPESYNSYIASDPSLRWDSGLIGKLASERLTNFDKINSTFWIAGLWDSYENMGIFKLDSLLKSEKVNNPKWKCNLYSDETHFSVQHKAFYDGLKFSYRGYNTELAKFHPMNGIIAKNQPISVHVFETDSQLSVTYTTDGSDPTIDSNQIERDNNIIIKEPTKLIVKSFPKRTDYSKTKEANFQLNTPPHPIGIEPTNAYTSKLEYSFFEGNSIYLKDFDQTRPVFSKNISPGFDLSQLKSGTTNSLHLIEGTVEMREDGYYVFATSADGAKLVVGGLKIIESDVRSDREQSFILPLKKGFYTFKLELFEKKDSEEVKFGCYRFRGIDSEWWKEEYEIFSR